MKKVTLIDFDDSFTYNLVGLFDELGYEVNCVHWKIFASKPDVHYFKESLIVLGPGPGHPNEYSGLFEHISSFTNKNNKVLGICLGHQILMQLLGGDLVPLEKPLHGTALSLPELQEFLDLPDLKAQFYNSWQVPQASVAKNVESVDRDGMVIYFRYKNFSGVQFHPESVGTTCPQVLTLKVLERLGV